jgi:hypothetical protein
VGVKLKSLGEPGGQRLLLFWCPGCKEPHPFRVERAPTQPAEVPLWGFNGDMERPTFTPSLLCDASTPATRCHLFLRDGRIEFLADCHHDLKGLTVECPDWDDELW